PGIKDAQVTMALGACGKSTQTLIEGLFVPAFGSPALAALADAGTVSIGGVDVALTTDSFVVKPIRFPGGSIGELAVNGTVNDLAVSGARPLALTLSLVLEEGLGADDLRAEGEAIAAAAEAAGGSGGGGGPTGAGGRPLRLDVHLHDGARPDRRPRAALAGGAPSGRPVPRLGLDRRARDGDHARARRVRARGGGALGHAAAVAGGGCAARRRRAVASL